MSDAAGLLIFPAIVEVAWLLSLGWPETTRRVARLLAASTGVLLLTLVATGLVRPAGPSAEIHKWWGHGLLIFTWNGVPFTIGVVLKGVRRRPVGATLRVLALLVLLGVSFLAATTGYLGPTHGPGDPNTLQRFRVLHCQAFPGLTILLTLYWFRFLRPDPGSPAGNRLDPLWIA